MTRRIRLLTLTLLTLTCGSPTFAQVQISGPQSGVLVDTTYLVTGNISVASGTSLIIEPGAEFLFGRSSSFYIDGYLLAAGTVEDSIRFLRNPGQSWHGIDFHDSASDSSLLEYCHVSGSTGGGVSVDRCSPTLSHCTITNNWNALSGGGIWCKQEAHPLITDCLISNNSCYDWGGGIACRWGSNPTIENCTITGNHGRHPGYAGFGAGIWCQFNSSPIIRNCLIYGNWADHQGAGITCDGGAAVITNCTIINNWTRVHQSDPCGVFLGSSTVTMTNCIAWGNTPQQILGSGRVAYSDVFNGWPGLGNIDDDPLFVSGPEGNLYLSQLAAGQTQQSPCVDAGDPLSAMIFGTTRTDGAPDSGIVDMGYHYPLPAGASMTASNQEEELFRTHNLELRISSFPNPFNATTVLRFELRAASFVKVGIYDLSGSLAANLVNGWRDAGSHEVTFDASSLPSGVYIARLEAGGLSAAQKLVLMK